MNRTYKVIWSKARRCYVVVSELAKSQHKSSTKSEHISSNVHRGYLGKAAAAAAVASLLTFGGLTYSPVMAAGDGVAIGTGSNAPKAENVAIGKGAVISYSNGASNATGDIVVGNGANINNYASQGGSIAIGKNAKVENMAGGGEASFAFGQTKFSGGWWSSSRIPADPSKVVGSIAIGDNTFARTGSTMIGSHNYKGDLGDTTVDSATTRTYALNVYATTIGANSFSNGAFTTNTGAYNIISSDYNGGRLANPVKNMGATITGALNSIESIKDADYYSGIANTVSGIANRTSNSNGTLIYGAGNEVTNSITDLTSTPTDSGKSAKEFAEKLRTSIKESKSGGATLVIGGGNKADYTQKTQILGVNNTVTGTEKNISDYNMIDGFGNTITGASHLYTIGTNNKITNTKNTILAGDDYTNVSGLTDSVIIGNNRVRGKDDKAEFAYFSNQKNIVSIGNKNVLDSTDGSISIGNNNFMWRSGGQPEKYGYDTGNVAIGNNTYINSYLNQGDSIVIGKNATAVNMGGTLEQAFAFGTPMGKDYSGSIAIGQNSYARSGSTMIGIHNYQGQLGDLNIDFTKDTSGGSSGIGDYQESIDATTIGNNSYNNGVFSTVVGSYTAVSGLYHNEKWGEKPYGVQNFGAAVLGSLNSVEGLTSTEHNTAGMADSILGSANRTKNANGTIMVGAGNVVEDSINDFDASEIKTKNGIASPNALSEAMRTSIKNANGGGAAAIVGNGNEVKQSTNVSVLGSKNKLTKTKSAQILGDNREVIDAEGAVIIGSASGTTPMTTDKKNVTILGYDANATVEGGVAIGSGSIANVGAGQHGYYVKHDQRSEEGQGYPFKNNDSAWISRAGAVSVGDTTNADQSKWITRQITGVAAGTKDTDAVNVAQLKNSQTRFYSVYDPGDDWLGIFPQIPNWEKYKNEDNQGAQGYWSMAAGFGTSTGGIASTVIGSLSKIDNKWTDGGPNGTQGATAVSLGTLNLNLSDQVTDEEVNSDDPRVIFQSKEDSGVANSIVGQGNLTKNSNGALIYGAGNIVTDSYRRVVANGDNDFESLANQDMESLLSNPEKAIKTIGKIVDISGGKVMVMGGGNVVDKAYDSQVMGVGNTVVGDAIKFEYKESPEVSNLPENTADEQFLKEASKDADVWTQYMGSIRKQGTLLNLVDGYYSTLKNGQNDYLIGTANEVTGDDASKNKSNIVFGDYHKLNNGNNNIIIGSADGAVVEKAKGYHEDYESGITTSQEITGQKQHTENLEDAVMIGHNADVQKNGGVALGADSVAKGKNSLAAGVGALANGSNSVAIGTKAKAQNDALAVGESANAGNNGIAIGMHANAGYGQNMALGYYASVADGVTNSTALGYGSQVTKRDILKSDGLDGVISVGKSVGQSGEKGMTRRIINVKAGVNDTDAVNVSQLKGVQDGLTHFYSVGSQDETAGNYNNDGAKGKNSLAAGVGALAKGDNSVAIGTNAKAQNDALAVGENASASNTGIAIGMHANAGWGQNMALGYYASVANDVRNSTALGYGSQVTKRDILTSDGSDGVISVGRSVGQSGEKGMTRRIINVKAGVNDTDAVNVSQLKQRAQAATTEVVAGTNIASVTKNDKTADGHTIYTVNAKGTTVSGDDNFNITSKTDNATNVTDYAISLKNTITIGSGTGTHPITINGTDGVVSGLTNTTWDKTADYSTSTKAATEAQLQKAMKDAQEAAEANDTDTHVKAGTYAVTTVKDAAGKDTQGVALDVVDKTGTPVGKVTITDVAKASDVGDVSKLSKEVQNDKGSTTVVDAINNVNTKVDTVDNKVSDLNYSSTHYVKSGDNVTTSISNLDKAIYDATTEAEKHHSTVSEGNNIKVKQTTTNGKTDYKVSLSDDINVNSVTAKAVTTDNLTVNKSATIGKVTINAGDKGTIGGLTNTTWNAKNITSGQAATEDQLQAATKNAVNYDGDDSKTITLREDTTINNVADTTIEQGSKNAVNAGTVYNETRVAKDGTFVKRANTAGENLSALDNQVTANTESIYHINNRVSDLDNRVNKVGAGAAALAALHPLDFDPDDKWDFAVGYGNYRNANSVAFGAFYRPNEDTMFSLGTNFGNGENMFNAGLSFKIGQGSGITTSKTAMAKKIESLEDTVDKQDKKIAELEALVKEQGEMIRQYVGKK
jgi:hypothetical protein